MCFVAVRDNVKGFTGQRFRFLPTVVAWDSEIEDRFSSVAGGANSVLHWPTYVVVTPVPSLIKFYLLPVISEATVFDLRFVFLTL